MTPRPLVALDAQPGPVAGDGSEHDPGDDSHGDYLHPGFEPRFDLQPQPP